MPLTETGAAAVAPRVVLYVRAGCHLCDDALAVVQEVCTEAGETWTTVDIDTDIDTDTDDADLAAGDGAGRSPGLAEEYADLVPVVHVDGVRRGYWRLDRDRLRAALAVAAPSA